MVILWMLRDKCYTGNYVAGTKYSITGSYGSLCEGFNYSFRESQRQKGRLVWCCFHYLHVQNPRQTSKHALYEIREILNSNKSPLRLNGDINQLVDHLNALHYSLKDAEEDVGNVMDKASSAKMLRGSSATLQTESN